jgi:cytochrome b6-f complex iron-sulfur subunit
VEQRAVAVHLPCHQGTFDRTGLNISDLLRPLDRLQIVKRGEQLYVNIQAT